MANDLKYCQISTPYTQSYLKDNVGGIQNTIYVGEMLCASYLDVARYEEVRRIYRGISRRPGRSAPAYSHAGR